MIKGILSASVAVAALVGTAWAETGPSGMGAGVMLRVGEGHAGACYQAVEQQRTDRDAIGDCTRALEREILTSRDRAATHVNRGILYLGVGEEARALADFNRAIVAEPNLAEAYTQRGLAQLFLHNYQAAVTDISHGLSMNPAPAEPFKAYYNRAVAYEELGNIRAAYADYRRANELAPEWDLARAELARFQLR
jgi:tetratricopeptide (TPR) repeat protein